MTEPYPVSFNSLCTRGCTVTNFVLFSCAVFWVSLPIRKVMLKDVWLSLSTACSRSVGE